MCALQVISTFFGVASLTTSSLGLLPNVQATNPDWAVGSKDTELPEWMLAPMVK